jgi:hypothetical protein
MRYTVHQPQMFSPIYLWARFLSVDTLVLLGEDYAKNEGWHTRFQLNAKNYRPIISTPLKARFGKTINEVQFADPERFFHRLRKTVSMVYSGCPNLDLVLSLLEYKPGETFGQYCTRTTIAIRDYLGVELLVLPVEQLFVHRPESASEWLANIGKSLGGETYVCAADAPLKYLETGPFAERRIAIDCQKYIMPSYVGGVDAQTSILDLLARCSKAEVLRVLRGV